MERSRRKKQKKWNKDIIKTSVLKIVVILIFIGLNWTGLLAIGNTFAYFFDNENSNANTYQASTLDFSLTSSNLNKFIGLTEKLSLGSVLTNSGSLGFQYTVASEKISGSYDFCNALELEAELNGIEKHDDSLISFDVLASTMLGSWSFEIKLPVTATNISHGETCEVDLVFKGWQTDVATYEDGGFSDEERIHLKFTSRMVVLNEFLPNPSGLVPDYGFDFGEDDSTMPKGEWVELYNNSDASYDLANWYIWDDSGDNANKIEITTANTYPSSTVIGAHDWLVVYMNKEVFDNDGDTVKLFNQTDELIDSYTYTDNDYCEIEPTPGDENATNTTGSCGGVPPNKSYARIPDGIGYWVDPIPTPGSMNKLEGDIIEITPEEEPIIEEEIPLPEEPIDDVATTTEEGTTTDDVATTTEEGTTTNDSSEESTTTEETLPAENEPVVNEEIPNEKVPPEEEQITPEESTETSGETTEDVVEETVEEITDETTTDEGVESDEAPVDEAPADEAPVEEAPIEEQPAAVPDDSPSVQDGAGEGGGETGDSSDGSSPAEGAGETSDDSGDAGDSVSEQ